MIAFAGMLVEAAKEAGIATPETIDNENIDLFKESHPYFWVFCMLQLGRSMESCTEHWENAKVIAQVSKEKLFNMTVQDFRDIGVIGV